MFEFGQFISLITHLWLLLLTALFTSHRCNQQVSSQHLIHMEYSRDQLIAINNINGLPSLPSDVITVLKACNIERDQSLDTKLIPSSVQPKYQSVTRRGVRAGRRIQRPIKARITHRLSNRNNRKVNHNNLIPVNIIPSTLHSGKKLKFCLFNAQSSRSKSLVIRDYISETEIDLCDDRDMVKTR